MPKDDDIEEWFKLTYDEDPKVRLKAAKKLAEYRDSPVATFALYELSYDKDEEVRNFAKQILNSWRETKSDNTQIPLDEILAEKIVRNVKQIKEEKKEIDINKEAVNLRDEILSALNGYIDINDKKRKELADSLTELIQRLLAEKSSGKGTPVGSKKEKDSDRTEGPKASKGSEERPSEETTGGLDTGTEEMDDLPEDYKTYLEVLSQIEKMLPERISHPETGSETTQSLKHPSSGSQTISYEEDTDEHGFGDVEEIVRQVVPSGYTETPSTEYKTLTSDTIEQWVYQQAIATLVSPNISKSDKTRTIHSFEREMISKIKSAIKKAKHDAENWIITSLRDLKPGMKGVNTDVFKVVDVQERKIKKVKRHVSCVRLIITDQDGNEFPVYLWGNRGRGIYENDKIKFENAMVETYESTGETVLTVDSKGKVYLIR